MHDIIVIGAGFTGLSAATDLWRAGANVLLLEARMRVGGRVESRVNGLGERIDTGGQFICDDMRRVMELARQHDKRLVPTHFDGDDTVQPPMDDAALEATYRSAMALRDRANAIDPADPMIDGLTVAAWLARQPETDDEKAAFRSMIEGLWCHALETIPLWHLIDNDRRITNETTELQYSVDGTLHALAEELAATLGRGLRLGQPVVGISRGATGMTVETAAGERHAGRAVLVAMPPSMAAQLAYHPPLPGALSTALGVWRGGAVIKCVLRYDTPFWRAEGRSGVVMWRDPVGLFACDTSNGSRAALSVFVGGPLALAWRTLDAKALRERIVGHVIAALGAAAARPRDVALRDWTDDAWSGGGYSDLIMDPEARDAEAIIATGAPPIHFACSEISPSYPGYVEGALVAGRMAARAMLGGRETYCANATNASGS